MQAPLLMDKFSANSDRILFQEKGAELIPAGPN